MKHLTMTVQQVRTALGLDPMPEICEWCKKPVRMMVQKGTGVCSQGCARLATNILFETKEKAEKFGGGYA